MLYPCKGYLKMFPVWLRLICLLKMHKTDMIWTLWLVHQILIYSLNSWWVVQPWHRQICHVRCTIFAIHSFSCNATINNLNDVVWPEHMNNVLCSIILQSHNNIQSCSSNWICAGFCFLIHPFVFMFRAMFTCLLRL